MRNSRSSSCARVIGAWPLAILRTPSHQPAAKPARYMRPYQRTANGPTENAIGSMLGWTSTRGLAGAARERQEVARGGAEAAARPGEPQVEPRVAVVDLAIHHAAPA